MMVMMIVMIMISIMIEIMIMIMGMMDDASEANFVLHQTDMVMMMVVVVMRMVMMTVIEVLNRTLDHHSDHYCFQSANHREFQKK